MNLHEVREAISDAERTLRNADEATDQMARLIVGRLRQVKGWGVLKSLKRELQSFNANSQTWKEDV